MPEIYLYIESTFYFCFKGSHLQIHVNDRLFKTNTKKLTDVKFKEVNKIKSVLVVEDNAENLELFLCLLKIKGYRPEVAMDGEKALELVNRCCFDLIILDIRLPIIDGFEVLKRLKTSKNPNTPVLVVTACTMTEDKIDALSERCISYLRKPFSMNQFHENISMLLPGHDLVKNV
ncbi:response regulator [Methanolobus halotolerans]|uniref:Response regulatory domain-containing protein n=1 Tax=Methanolobus halotolerans TaxID=2052935 RepID=A0A4E0PWK7_9EURY|nr:response regulator [Methanolobus halotolerans]TGC06932.1 hypothetical protein CUN85_12390 [Methanolobus halotolerans]